MATLTSLLNLSKNALLAEQTALNVTANNVANQTTPGYVRQTVNFETVDTITLGLVHYGQGVSIGVGATSVRDRVLEQRVQQQQQTASQSGSLVATLNLVQNIFGLSSSTTSAATTTLGTAIDGLFNSFSTLEANPADAATRNGVISAASNLAQGLNAASSQLTAETGSLNVQVGSTVEQINTLLSAIADLNNKIVTTSPGRDAGALEDQRQVQIAKLSTFIGLDQITTENNGITLTTTGPTGGALLVGGVKAFPLSTSQSSGKTLVHDANNVDITGNITGGSLGGLLQARDTILPGLQTSLDELAFGVATRVNTQNGLGNDLNGNTGVPLFTVPVTATNAAAQIAVVGTGSQIAAATTTEGPTGTGNASLLASLANDTTVVTNASGNTQSASGFFASFLSGLGSQTSAAQSDNTVQEAALTQLTSQRDSISAVSLNEEAANLSNYQRSYQAAAKIFTIVDSLLADALNLGVQTAVS